MSSIRPDFWATHPRPLCLAGPTGSGKSALAVEIAQQLGAEIVNVDGFQIYAGLPILTAQPSPTELATVQHHLYGSLPLTEECNAGRYVRLATDCIQQLQAKGIRPLLVGGSGMYLKALTHGLNELPTADAGLRARLEALSTEEMIRQLLELDPAAGSHINLRNPRHAQRALEICILTGQPASQLKQAWQADPATPDGVFLQPDRQLLYARINQRCQHMLDHGALSEVAVINEISGTARKAIGLAEIQAHQAGQLSLETVYEHISQSTRRYAKRQLSWFRGQGNLLSVENPEHALGLLASLG